jgi:outer membrane lipoprotein SlyB
MTLVTGAALAADPAPSCPDCGTVRSIREVDREMAPPPTSAEPAGYTSPGDFPGGLGGNLSAGWVATARYKPGDGMSRGYVGAVGSPELREQLTERSYEIVVKLDNGRFQLVREDQPPAWQVGDRVRIVMGKLLPAEK